MIIAALVLVPVFFSLVDGFITDDSDIIPTTTTTAWTEEDVKVLKYADSLRSFVESLPKEDVSVNGAFIEDENNAIDYFAQLYFKLENIQQVDERLDAQYEDYTMDYEDSSHWNTFRKVMDYFSFPDFSEAIGSVNPYTNEVVADSTAYIRLLTDYYVNEIEKK